MRTFIALDLDHETRHRISRYLDGLRGFAPDARWVRPESLHVTLKFVGEQSEDEVDKINRALQTIKADHFCLNIRGYGFFPGAKAPRVFWIGIEADPKLSTLAAAVDETLMSLGIPKEEHAFTPHLTLARSFAGSHRSRKPNGGGDSRGLQILAGKLASLTPPEFGAMTAREFFLYLSRPSSEGSKYTKLAGFPLH